MAKKNQETGHAKNVAQFEKLISFCKAYGTKYNPSNPNIKLTALNTLHTSAKNALVALNTERSEHTIAVNDRDIAFKNLAKLTTRIINAVAASNVPEQIVADVETIARKLKGQRASKKEAPTLGDDGSGATQQPKTISASQMSFDSRIENLDKLIKLLTAQSGYAPNEADLKLTALTTLLNSMKTANTAVISALTELSNTRIERNNILYTPQTGLVNIAQTVKRYVKSVFGQTSEEYKQVSGLRFVRVGKL